MLETLTMSETLGVFRRIMVSIAKWKKLEMSRTDYIYSVYRDYSILGF